MSPHMRFSFRPLLPQNRPHRIPLLQRHPIPLQRHRTSILQWRPTPVRPLPPNEVLLKPTQRRCFPSDQFPSWQRYALRCWGTTWRHMRNDRSRLLCNYCRTRYFERLRWISTSDHSVYRERSSASLTRLLADCRTTLKMLVPRFQKLRSHRSLSSLDPKS